MEYIGFNQLFAMLLEVIFREIRPIFNQTYLFLCFLEGKGIIYHLIAYDVELVGIFGCHGNRFFKFQVVFRKILEYPKNIWPFSFILIAKNEPLILNTP